MKNRIGLFAFLIGLLLAPSLWAFPDNGVLETFTGSDNTTPPNSNWTNAVLNGASSGTLEIFGNGASGGTSGIDSDAYWNVQTFGPDSECYATITNLGSTNGGIVHVRLANIGASTTDGYRLEWQDAGNVLSIDRLDNGTPTTLGSTISQTISIGDKVGISAIGDQICAWYKVGAGAWTQLSCRTDSTYTAAGYIGLSISNNSAVSSMDDFGGGTITTVTSGKSMMLLGVGP